MLALFTGALVSIPLAEDALASDCAAIFYPYAEGPVLGVITSFGPEDAALAVPSNCVFTRGGGLTDGMGEAVVLQPSARQPGFWEPVNDLPAGDYRVLDGPTGRSWSLMSTGAADQQSPSQPVLTSVFYEGNGGGAGCGRTSPGCDPTYAEFEVERERVQDDLTPDESITLAFHFGETEEEAQQTQERVLVAAGNQGTVRLPATEGPWFAVSAIDLAGNESPRTTAISYLPNSEGGCRIGGGVDPSAAGVMMIAAVILAWRRKRHLTIICNRRGLRPR